MFSFLHDLYDDPYERYGLLPSFLDNYSTTPRIHLHIPRPRRQMSTTSLSGRADGDSNTFQIMLNVKHFRSDEIDVKTVDDFVVIHGQHEEHADEHGLVSREFTRRYKLPEDVEPSTVSSSLSRDGVLTIRAPRKQLEPPPKNERVVPITIQQPAAVEEAQKQQQQLQDQAAQQQSSEEPVQE